MTSDVVRWTRNYDKVSTIESKLTADRRDCDTRQLVKSNRSLSTTTTITTSPTPTSTPITTTTITSSISSPSSSSSLTHVNYLSPPPSLIYRRRFSDRNCRSLVIMSKFRCKSKSQVMLNNVLQVLLIILKLNVIFSSFFVIVSADDILEGSGFDSGHFTPTWAVHIPDGDNGIADEVARTHGFTNLGKIIDDHYHFQHKSVKKRSISPSHSHQERLNDDERVLWSKQQRAKSRQKRDFIRMRPPRTSQPMTLVNSVQLNDPKWPNMWYLNRGNGLDMNVIPAWKEGITGKGVVVTILDDGLESDHPDLEHNYDPKASYDVNSHDDDPMPHYDMADSNRHGTRCAGEVAATANNSLCAVGIAFGASVGGVRMLDGDVTDAVEARSLSLNPQHIDIYSASWGPDDDGKTVDGPGEMASRAFIEGVNKGRNGKGSIFIWASGNGGREQDNCNCDGYTNSIWTLSISSATEEGHVPWYSEKCSSTLATTYSSGAQNEKQVVTTDLHHSCTISHTGTSASAPLAAGIVALVLEANRNLTWRDLQHIVVRTAKPGNLKDPTWSRNGVGRRVSHSFGYGLMDAAAMVQVARTWKTVPEQQRCEVNAPHIDKPIHPRSFLALQLTVKHCMGVNFLEHVQAKITLTSQKRGDIQIFLTSPAGTKVTLLTSRAHDVSRSGFNQWPFMSVHTWGEAPHGNWQLEIHNEGKSMGHTMLREWSLIFYGTTAPIDPNDPISVRPTPSGNSTSTISQSYSAQYPKLPSNSYSVVVLNRPNSKGNSVVTSSGGNGSNKKQQQQQQFHQISSYGVVISPKKNGKNSKNNSSGSKGSGKNSGSGSQKPSTNRPSNAQSTANLYGIGSNSKNNLYRISTPTSKSGPGTGKQSTSGTTQRPKLSQQSNYNANFGGKADKPLRGYEKIPIKAPKQVKDNIAYSTVISSPLPPQAPPSSNQRYDSYERISAQNQRIPKLFQQYEKIQQIFPEFHPYTGPKETSPLSSPSKPGGSSNRKQSQFYEPLDGGSGGISRSDNLGSPGNRPGSGNGSTNPKPSRENSKKMPQNFQNEQREKLKDRVYIPNRKSANAQITQWDLIFYGTEKPAQPEDPIRISPGKFGAFGEDMEHNFLTFDPETASGQWRNMQQVGESQVDIQRNANDQTSSACINYSPDQRCIECHQTTFFYKGRCYATCPSQSYMVPEVPNTEDNNIDSDTLSLNVRSTNDALTQRRAIRKNYHKLCESCDPMCLRCKGPYQSDCLACHPGYQLRRVSAQNSYCYVFTERSSGNSRGFFSSDDSDSEDGIRKDILVFLMIIVPALTLIVIVVVITLYRKSINLAPARQKNYVYDTVGFGPSNEEEASGLLGNEEHDNAAEKPSSIFIGPQWKVTQVQKEEDDDASDDGSE